MSSQQESEALLAAAREAVFVFDEARTFIDANPAGCRLLGLSARDLLGRRLDDFLEPGLDLETAWRSFLQSGELAGELQVIRLDGEVRHVEYSATARFVAGRHLAILRDIASRKREEAERAELRQREQLRLRETETLLAVSRALSSTLDPTETMRRVGREIARALGADMVGAYLADVARERLWPVAGYHVPPELLDDFRRFPIPIKGHPAIEEAWADRRAVWTDDMPGDPRVDPEALRRFPHQSDLFVPIRVKDRAVGGFFVIWWTARRSFTEWEIRVLQGISDLAGIFLENAQLYRETAEANRAKDEFLATLSHELRNPMGAIAGALGVLDLPGVRPEAAERARAVIRRQIANFSRLMDDLLDVSRLTSGKTTPFARVALDLAAAVQAVVDVMGLARRTAGREVSVELAPVWVDADPSRIEQIITNLIGNALKYTPPGGRVTVRVSAEDGAAALTVADTGVGIAADVIHRVFELFVQGERPLDRADGGLGIGLTLVKALVELHGGSVTAASEGPGRGATFTVRLPSIVPPSDGRAAARPARAPVVPRRVLIVEDNADAREMLGTALASAGHEVCEADTGTAALDAAARFRPDVGLIDIGLPGVDGYEVARRLRATDDGKRMLLVALTGYGQPEDRRRARAAGFDAHLTKPVLPEQLAEVLTDGASEKQD